MAGKIATRNAYGEALTELAEKYPQLVVLDADLANPASWKTMEAFEGKRVREYYDDQYAHCTVVDYVINVRKALAEHTEYIDMTF